MITGVNKVQTGSYDTHWNSKLSTTAEYGYLGSPAPPTPQTWYTWRTGSNEASSNELSMYTPYPSSIERGKLYWVGIDDYVDDLSIPNKTNYVQLNVPQAGYYRVVTPTLNNSSLQLGYHIAQYDFEDINDLWTNGWKVQQGNASGGSPALISEAEWNNIKNDGDWAPLGNPADEDVKAKIVAAILGCTPTAYSIATTKRGLAVSAVPKGAILLGGDPTLWDNTTYRGMVPLVEP